MAIFTNINEEPMKVFGCYIYVREDLPAGTEIIVVDKAELEREDRKQELKKQALKKIMGWKTMSEEEIISEIEIHLCHYKLETPLNKAMRGLLDLYQKEKEKNENCKKQEYTVGRLEERKVWQDKIKAKIEEVEQEKYTPPGEIFAAKVLQELLEE